MKRDWKKINNRLVRQGTILIDLRCLEGWKAELSGMNACKEGAKFRYPNSVINYAGVLHCLLGLGFRQVEGFLSRVLSATRRPVPEYSTLNRRFNKLPVEFRARAKKKGEPFWIAIDASGMAVTNRGEWMRKIHRKGRIEECRGFLKIHVAVDVHTKEVVAMEVTTDKIGDNRMLPSLVAGSVASTGRAADRLFGDGSFDTEENFEELVAMGIEPVIRIDRNAITTPPPDTFRQRRRGEPLRRKHAREQLADYDKWRKERRYGLRWMAESFFSVFKRRYGEHATAKKFGNMQHEMLFKAALYNLLL